MVRATFENAGTHTHSNKQALHQLEDDLEAWEAHVREQFEAIVSFIYTEGASGYYETPELERGVIIRLASLSASLLCCLKCQRKLSHQLRQEFGLPVDAQLS